MDIMFGSKCQQCGQKLVRLMNLKSYGNYLICPNLYQSMLTNFKHYGQCIYCCGLDEEKPVVKKPKEDRCVYCDQKLIEIALMKPFTLYHVCPTVIGFFLYAYETKQKGLETKIHCKTKIEVEARLKKYATITLARGTSNYPLSKVHFSNGGNSDVFNLRIRVDIPKGWSTLVTPEMISKVPVGGSCDFEIRLSIPESTEPGEYFIRYGPFVEKLGETKLEPTKVLKIEDFGTPSIIKVKVV